MRGPVSWFPPVTVEFDNPEDCDHVHQLMEDEGMLFAHAVDYLELRPFTHYSVTRTDCGPDGHR